MIVEAIINLAMWLFIFQAIAYLLFLIKYILISGFGYFRRNTLVASAYRALTKVLKKAVDFDFSEKTNKSILRFIIPNLIVLLVLVSAKNANAFQEFGIFLVIAYSIILFRILTKKMRQIKQDYDVLLASAKKLSEGNFNGEIKENLGVFNSLGVEFANIKEGFEKAVVEEVKSQRMKTELVSNVSHDLKTPLTSIITYIDLLKDPSISEEDRAKYVETLDRNALRLKNLIDDLFEVSKANSGNISLHKTEVDVVSLLRQVHFECLDYNKDKNFDFKLEFPDDKVILSLDSGKTYRIFENLFNNIYKYALANTRVYIKLIETQEDVEIEFKNISENEIKIQSNELTERFVQGDSSRNTSGSGLGLAIAKSFTTLQGGTLDIRIDGDLFKVEIKIPKN